MTVDYTEEEFREALDVVRVRAADEMAQVVQAAHRPTRKQIDHLRRLLPPPTPEQIRAALEPSHLHGENE
ncbi:hypothetical protein [Amycolatopsis sp. NPDC051071]|uniref:hypothetical protein n=1 Tax=Amycolatopsis sp. NPDC051071 TaxID=3154637 RepID=UPI00341CA2AD